MRRHLLVTNDFPPKVGGIQSYLWELWRRLPPDDVTVLTTPYAGTDAFDAASPIRILRSPEPVLLPHPGLVSRIREVAIETGAELVIFDPALPVGAIGPFLGLPYGVVLHGAEVTIPARVPGSKAALRRVLDNAALVIAAGDYALAEADRCATHPLPSVVIPPGVDTERFTPPNSTERLVARERFHLEADDLVIASVNRLVPRKGIDVLIRSVQRLSLARPNLRCLVGGTGRERRRLEALASELGAPVQFLGRMSDADVVRLYQAADVMAMLCHDRWLGLEQEGFGIVFLEAAACGIPQVAGASGGAAEAVEPGKTGLVVDQPRQVASVTSVLSQLLDGPELRQELGDNARARAEASFSYDYLARKLITAIDGARLR